MAGRNLPRCPKHPEIVSVPDSPASQSLQSECGPTRNPTLNHQDTKSTKHTPDIPVRTLFVSLCLCGELLSRFWGPSVYLTNAEILASLVVINQEDERQTMAATPPRERDSIAVLTNARR